MVGLFLIRLSDCEQLVQEFNNAEDRESQQIEGRALTAHLVRLGVSICEPECEEVMEDGMVVTVHPLRMTTWTQLTVEETYFEVGPPSQVLQ